MSKHVVAYSSNESASNDGCGYWSNEHGWTLFEDATRFLFESVKDKTMPMSTGGDAVWVALDLKYFHHYDLDPLTVAFVTLGFSMAYAKLTDKETEQLNQGCGQSEMISKIVTHAAFLDGVFNESSDAFGAVSFYYEIAEPFGCEYTKALATAQRDGPLSDQEMEALAIRVLKTVCQKAIPEEHYPLILQHV